MADFLNGFRYALGGFRLLGHPAIRTIMLTPLMINIVLFALIIVYGTNVFSELLNGLIQQWAWLAWFTWLIWPLFLLLLLGIVFFSFTVVANLIAAPFNGYLATAVEGALGVTNSKAVPPSAGLVMEFRSAMGSELEKMQFFFVRGVPLLFLFVIPVLQLVAPLLWFIYAIWMIALEYIEIPLGNHGNSFADVRALASDSRSLVLGFGCGVLVLTMLPGLNLVVIPVAVAGATRMTLERLTDAETGKIQFA